MRALCTYQRKCCATVIYHSINAKGSSIISIIQGQPLQSYISKLLWQIEICNPDLVWRWFWNSEIIYFLSSQPVFRKCLLSDLYWTRCKSPPSFFFDFLSFFVKFVQFFFRFWAYMTNWLLRRLLTWWCQHFFLFFKYFYIFFIHSWK